MGLVARMAPKGRTVPFGYFFGPRRAEIPALDEMANLQPSMAILLKKFGTVDLDNGRWTVLGRLPDWNREQWSMPSFLRKSIPPDKPVAKIITHDQNNPLIEISEVRVPAGEPLPDLPGDGLAGSGAIEIMLEKLLSNSVWLV